jgi:FkbM family methyltransferase
MTEIRKANDVSAMLKSIGKWGFNFLPQHSTIIYSACKRYVDRYNGDNNCDPLTNGEYVFLRNELFKKGALTVFDVGANIGDWAQTALSVNPFINLHCFEPSRYTFDILQSKQLPSNVSCRCLGLGEASGELDLHIAGNGVGTNSLYARKGVFDSPTMGTEKVSIETVDNYCDANEIKRIDFMKVDVEGHELAVFKGMKNLLAQRGIEVIQFEYGGTNLDARVYLGDIWDFFGSECFL